MCKVPPKTWKIDVEISRVNCVGNRHIYHRKKNATKFLDPQRNNNWQGWNSFWNVSIYLSLLTHSQCPKIKHQLSHDLIVQTTSLVEKWSSQVQGGKDSQRVYTNLSHLSFNALLNDDLKHGVTEAWNWTMMFIWVFVLDNICI